MATRNSVETKIAAINDKGNNSAAEVRDVLTELLNYTENQAITESFHIFSSSAISSTDKNKNLFFSIKGKAGETANMTLMIKSTSSSRQTKSNNNTFVIPFDQTVGMFTIENFNLLAGKQGNGIIPLIDDGNFLSYIIPFLGDELAQGCLNIALAKKYGDYKNSLLLAVVDDLKTGSISTSISMHSQKFDQTFVDVINPRDNKRTTVDPKGKTSTPTKKDPITFFNQIFSQK